MRPRSGQPQIPGFVNTPSREELPYSLMSVKILKVQDRPDLIVKFSSHESKTIPLPPDLDEKQKGRNRHLAQYGGRSKEGTARSILNIQLHSRSVHMSDLPPAVTVPATIPTPIVPAMIPDMPRASLMRGKALRVCMSVQEYDLYTEMWINILGSHSDDYNYPEDLMDVHRVCMETVIQFRIEQEIQRCPTKMDKMTKSLDSSVNRMQKARENLLATRRDRVNSKKKDPSSTINIAIMAGNTPVEQVLEERQQKLLEDKNDINKFLEGTVVETSIPTA